MSWNPNSNKHKAQHGGYKQKPTRQQVKALLDLYAGVQVVNRTKPTKKEEGNQLSFDF
jgi:hypothetical protein